MQLKKINFNFFKLSMKLLLIFLFTFQSLEIPIDYFVNETKSIIHFLYDNRIDSYDLKDDFSLKKTIKFKNSSDFDLTKFKFVEQSKLSSNYGGTILVIKKDSIERIDNSYEHRMQFNSVEFIKNDTLFRYGGYGFFENRNFFTYYNDKINGWESWDIEGSVIPDRISDFVYYIDEDKLFITGGFKTNHFKKNIKIENYNSYKFDFNTKKWSLVGKMKTHFSSNNSLILKDEVFIFQDDSVYNLNFKLNSITTYYKNPISIKVESSVLKPYLYDDKILIFNFLNGGIEINSISLDNFISNLEIKNSSQIYPNSSHLVFIVIIILLIMLLVILINKYIIKEYYKKLRKFNDSYYYNFVVIPLLKNEKKVLDILYESCRSLNNVENRDITSLFYDDNLNYGTINRRKNETIKQLNNKLQLVFKTSENVIIKSNSEIDKREINYSLNSRFI